MAGDTLWRQAGISVPNMGIGEYLVATSNGLEIVGKINGARNQFKVQRYDSTGQMLWPASGFTLALSDTGFFDDLEACSDGENGLVAVLRLGPGGFPNDDLYAARMRSDGSLGNLLPPPPYAPIYTQRQLYLRGSTVVFHLPQAEEIQLELYDLLGRKIISLAQGRYSAGESRIVLREEGLSSGVYWVKLTAGGEDKAVKVVICH